jgi:hypothetical protein
LVIQQEEALQLLTLLSLEAAVAEPQTLVEQQVEVVLVASVKELFQVTLIILQDLL